jgi:hypothetical protein
VVIRNSKISCTSGYAVYVDDKSWNAAWTPLLIEDSEISCGANNATGIGEAHVTLRRSEISGCENGLDVNWQMTVEDSFIHDLYNGGAAHADGLQMSAGHFENGVLKNASKDVTIRHNTIYAADPQGNLGTSAIISNRGGDTNILIQNNLMAGGAVPLYCEQGATGINYRVLDNHFSRKYRSTVGEYGISTDCSDEQQSGNVIHETGEPVRLP